MGGTQSGLSPNTYETDSEGNNPQKILVTDRIVSTDKTGNLTETGFLDGAKYLIKIVILNKH